MRETVEEMRVFEVRLAVEPFMLEEVVVVRQAARFENAVDHFPGAKAEAWLIGNAEALCELLDDEKVGTHRRRRFDELRAEQDMLLAAAAVNIVMLHEHRGRNDDIGKFPPYRS